MTTRTHEYYDNDFEVVRRNTLYRKVLRTLPHCYQSVAMSLAPGESIPKERHDETLQGFVVVSGRGKAIIGKKTRALKKHTFLSVRPGVAHTIANTSKTHALKLFTFYVPPEHAAARRDRRQPRSSYPLR